jgi:hypothetical protein
MTNAGKSTARMSDTTGEETPLVTDTVDQAATTNGESKRGKPKKTVRRLTAPVADPAAQERFLAAFPDPHSLDLLNAGDDAIRKATAGYTEAEAKALLGVVRRLRRAYSMLVEEAVYAEGEAGDRARQVYARTLNDTAEAMEPFGIPTRLTAHLATIAEFTPRLQTGLAPVLGMGDSANITGAVVPHLTALWIVLQDVGQGEVMRCRKCRNLAFAERSDAVYCSDTCRVAVYTAPAKRRTR